MWKGKVTLNEVFGAIWTSIRLGPVTPTPEEHSDVLVFPIPKTQAEAIELMMAVAKEAGLEPVRVGAEESEAKGNYRASEARMKWHTHEGLMWERKG